MLNFQIDQKNNDLLILIKNNPDKVIHSPIALNLFLKSSTIPNDPMFKVFLNFKNSGYYTGPLFLLFLRLLILPYLLERIFFFYNML